MILPANYDILVWRNGIYRQRFQLEISGSNPDITGETYNMNIRANAGDTGPPVVALSTTINANLSIITLPTPTQGVFEVFISNTDLAVIPEAAVKSSPVIFNYNIIRHEAGGDYYPVYYGKFTVNEGVNP